MAITREPIHEEEGGEKQGEKDKEEKERFYYIVKERIVGGRVLRSQAKSGEEKVYLIKTHSDPNFEEWVNANEIKRLHNGRYVLNIGQWFESAAV